MSQEKLGPRTVPARGSGNLHCGFYDEVTDEQHNHYFTTIQEFREHLHEMPHLHKGNSNCNDCGTPGVETHWYGKLHPSKLVAPTLCGGCHEERKKRYGGQSS